MQHDNRSKTRKPSTKPRKEGENKAVVVSDKFSKINPVQAKPLEIIAHGNFDKALRAFRALVQKERILSTFKEKQGYEKPSDKKRRKRNEMQRKRLELTSSEDRARTNGRKNRRFSKREQDKAGHEQQ